MTKIIIFCLFLFTSCMEDNLSPESALKSFIEDRIGHIVTREYVLDRVTGKLLENLKNMEEDDFIKFSDLRNVKKDSFKILSKSCQEQKCFITYSVGYSTSKENKVAFVSEIKKIVEIINVNGKWLISDISNVKTYHESLEPIYPLE